MLDPLLQPMLPLVSRLAPTAAAAAWSLLAAAWPWIVFPLVALWRVRGSRSLADVSPTSPAAAPLVSVIVPARDEARSIERCLRSLIATRYPHVEFVVVDDHSSDGTGDLARRASEGDPRLRVVVPPPLPDGWMGKQWACATGAELARGAILCFADADTIHAPDLLPRAVNAMRTDGAALLSVVGRQELGGFWERAVQPLVFAVLAARFGGTERVTRSPRVEDKIANGQCLLVTRAAYDAAGGHAAVRDRVSEDLVLAQRVFAAAGHDGPRRVSLILGGDQLATRMYRSLGELIRGWRKNMYAGGAESTPPRSLARLIFPLMILFPPAMLLLPPALLALFSLGVVGADTARWAAVAALSTLAFAVVPYRRARLSPLWALAYPLGASVLLVIVVQAIARGRRVSWKGRAYGVSSSSDVAGDRGPLAPDDGGAHPATARAAAVGDA
ncbi:MAG TPA: glycosyltransferase family 2 protein [Gemmatimonadaceae bacterium]|nr:glycosyltransferase family 2 protein [Gemmatimonadaceae bacterium]